MLDQIEIEADESKRDREKEALAASAFERIRTGQHWRDWMFIADGLLVGRFWAQRRSGTDNIQDPKYRRAFREWMNTRPWAAGLDNPTRSHLFWCGDHRSEIEAWRETLAQNERNKFNHPTTLKRRYEAANVVKPPKTETTVETSAMRNEREIERLTSENETLRKQAERDGSLFDLKGDSVKSIALVIANTVSIGRLASLRDALTEEYKRRKAADKTPAKAG